MLYNYKEIIKKYKNDYCLNIAIQKKKIYKLGKGLYSDKLIPNRIAIIIKKYHGIILSLDSALFYYSLSSKKPSKLYFATRRNYTRIREDDVIQIFNIDCKLDYKSLHYTMDGISLNIYSRERLLVEFLRNIKKYDDSYIDEVMYNFKKISNSLDRDLVITYAKRYKVFNAEKFAIKYIHNVDDYGWLYNESKEKVYSSILKSDSKLIKTKCICCNSIFESPIKEPIICTNCGWWVDDYISEPNEVSLQNHKSLIDYRNNYHYIKKNHKDYIWKDDRNRIPKYDNNQHLEEIKNICACCKKNSVKKWYDQCEFCGWIADYNQEKSDFYEGPNIYNLDEYTRKYRGMRIKIKNYKWINYKNEWKEQLIKDESFEYIKIFDIKYL